MGKDNKNLSNLNGTENAKEKSKGIGSIIVGLMCCAAAAIGLFLSFIGNHLVAVLYTLIYSLWFVLFLTLTTVLTNRSSRNSMVVKFLGNIMCIAALAAIALTLIMGLTGWF